MEEFEVRFKGKINSRSGSSNIDWENTGNWNCGALPDKNTDVLINAGKPNYPEVTYNRVCRSIVADPANSLKVKAGKILMIPKLR